MAQKKSNAKRVGASRRAAEPAIKNKPAGAAPAMAIGNAVAAVAYAAELPKVSAGPREVHPQAQPQTSAAECARLIAALRDPSAEIARDAAAELGRLGDPAAVESLIEVVANSDGFFHCVARTAAAESLGRLGDLRAVPVLLRAVNDPMAECSAESVRALAELRDGRAIETLVAVLRNSDGFFLPIVRRAAVAALARIGGPAARSAIQEVVFNAAEDPVIRESARQALA